MSFLFDSNLFVEDVNLMYLHVSSDVTKKGILVSYRGMMKNKFQDVYEGLMKGTHVYP